MDCPTCIPILEKEVKDIEGVKEVKGNYLNKTLRVIYDSDKANIPEIETAIERVGYRIAYKKYPGIFSRLKSIFKNKEKIELITDADFQTIAQNSSYPVAVLFSSPTCPTCRIFKQDYQEIAEKLEGKAKLYEMDISNTETWRHYDILSIPTVIILKSGKVTNMFTALPKKEGIMNSLEI